MRTLHAGLLVIQVKYLNTKTISILDLGNFYTSGSSFSRAFKGVATAEEFLEMWEQKNGYHTGTVPKGDNDYLQHNV